ncbi:MAG: hypothetical protein Q8L29_00095 [archaeon]|nr:hypothetical protein [archaeon]
MNKRGQVAIIIILAVVIVSAVVAVFLYPRIKVAVSSEVSPTEFLQSCIQNEVEKEVVLLGKNAGYKNMEGTLTYDGEEYKYLCYTSNFYDKCIVQQPLIKEKFETELNEMIKSKGTECVQTLKAEYEKRGYTVSTGSVQSEVSVIPSTIRVKFISPMTITKEQTQTFNEFNVNLESEMYDLLMIATSIIDFEVTYGNSETTLYMQYYPDLKIEKIQLSDGSRIYKLSNVVTEENFMFASRSIAWPPGYGI